MQFDTDFEFVFADDDESSELSPVIEDADESESDENELTEDELSPAERAALLKEIEPTITSIKALIDSFETRLVTAFKLSGRDFIEWQQSPYGQSLEALFALHKLIHRYEHAVLHDTSIQIALARNKLEQRSSEAFDRAKELIEKSMLGKVAA